MIKEINIAMISLEMTNADEKTLESTREIMINIKNRGQSQVHLNLQALRSCQNDTWSSLCLIS